MRKIKFVMAPALAAGLLAAGAAAAHAAATGPARSYSDTYYVSPYGQSGNSDYSCRSAAHSSISAAVAAARPGDTVVVCDGIYKDEVVIRKPLNLVGRAGAVIDARGQRRLNVGGEIEGSIGIGVVGTHDVRVSGFKVEYAGVDGILVWSSSYVSVTSNVLVHNGTLGVNLNGSSWSHVTNNVAEYNAEGGFLVADDGGRAYHNDVSYNVASHNAGGGGVILAGHSTAGVTDNLVSHNVLTDNGWARSHSGGGVVIATSVAKETVADNTVTGNDIHGNGLAGVTIHAHMPGENLNGNWITDNNIGVNDTIGDSIGLSASSSSKSVPDARTTGILVGTASPIRVRISGNSIHDNHFGVFLEGKGAGVYAALFGNEYKYVDVPVEQIGG
jgi:parallel beta-helix repeat protein